jgi:hypothetical protein
MRGPAYSIAVAGLVLASTACGSAHAAAAASVYVSPGGSDSAACTQTAPCASFDRAYHAAAPGGTVTIAAGSYPAQTISDDPSKDSSSSNVVFTPAKGADVTIAGDLDIRASHVIVRGSKPYDLHLQTLWVYDPASHVEADDLDGATFEIFGSTFVTIRGGDWGPGDEPGTTESRISPDGGVLNSEPHDILLDGLYIHDHNSSDLTQYHNGGMELVSGYNITIRNTTFARNVVYDIEVQDFTSPACCGMKYGNAHDVLLEDNWFGNPVLGPPYGTAADNDGQPELQMDPQGGAWTNWTLRNNSFANGPAVVFDGPPTQFSGFTVANNIGGGLADCGGATSGATWQGNIWTKGPCSSGDASVPAGYKLEAGRLVVDATAAAPIRRAFALAAAKKKTTAIARTLRWGLSRVRAALHDKLYLGNVYGPPGAQPPLVSKKLWQQAQKAVT